MNLKLAQSRCRESYCSSTILERHAHDLTSSFSNIPVLFRFPLIYLVRNHIRNVIKCLELGLEAIPSFSPGSCRLSALVLVPT